MKSIENGIKRVNRMRLKRGMGLLPPFPWEGKKVSWIAKSGGREYLLSGTIVETMMPSSSAENHRMTSRLRCDYKISNAGSMEDIPKPVVYVAYKNKYRTPLLTGLKFDGVDSSYGIHENFYDFKTELPHLKKFAESIEFTFDYYYLEHGGDLTLEMFLAHLQVTLESVSQMYGVPLAATKLLLMRSAVEMAIEGFEGIS